jgi:hypothetical protein
MDELLKKYDLNEISKRTSISPVVLQKLIEEKFEGVEELKFKGFLKILKFEFKDIDFSELEEKAKSYYFNADNSKKTDKQQIIEKLEDEKSYKDYLFVLILIIAIVGLIYYMNSNKKIQIENNYTNLETLKVIEKNDTNLTTNEINVTKENKINLASETNEVNMTGELENNKTEKEINLTTIKENNSIENNISKIKTNIETNLTIKPLRKVWFRVYYLDLNKSKEFLTNNVVELNASKKMFIKFGHGMVKLFYHSKVLFLNSKRVTRVILQNNEINITKKRLKSFK